MHSPRENRILRSPSPRRGRSYSPRSIDSSQSYDDRSYSRSRSRSRSFSRRSTSRDSRSPYRNQYGYRRYYSRSPLPRRRPRRSPPPLPPPPPSRRFRTRSPPPRRLSRSGPPRVINNACRVYVGNLSFETKWHHLKDFMREAGHVVHADVLTTPNGRSKGCGIVEYRYPEGAKIAIHTLNKVEFMGRTIFVKEINDYSQWGENGKPPVPKHKDREYESTSLPKDPRDAPDDCRLFIDNLPFSASWQDMKDLFRRAGRVLHTDIHTDPGSRRSNGTGTVIFADPRDAQNAIDILDGFEWKGRVIEVNEFNNRNRPRLPRVNNREREPMIPSTRPPPPPTAAAAAASSSSVDIVYQNSEAPKYSMVTPPPPPPAAAQPPPPQQQQQQQQQQAAAAAKIEPMYDNVYRYGQDVSSMVPPPPPPPSIQSAPIYNMNLIGGPHAHLPTHGQNQVFVNNLPFSTTWQDLIDLFRHVGPVVRSEVLTLNGHPKGSGYVRFEDAATCAKAIGKFNGYMYGGRQLDIRLDKYST